MEAIIVFLKDGNGVWGSAKRAGQGCALGAMEKVKRDKIVNYHEDLPLERELENLWHMLHQEPFSVGPLMAWDHGSNLGIYRSLPRQEVPAADQLEIRFSLIRAG